MTGNSMAGSTGSGKQGGKALTDAKKFGGKATMNQRIAQYSAWSMAVFSAIVVMTGLVISLLPLIAGEKDVIFSHQFFTPVFTITYGVVGALVASRHPRNPLGWIFCAIGFLSALNMFGAGYVKYDLLAVQSGSLPGADFARWLDTWVWLLNVLLPVTFLLLLFPNGRLPSPRWRPIAWAAGLGTIAVIFGMAFHPGSLGAMGISESNPFGIPGGAEVTNALMAVSVPLLLVGVLGSIASVVVRFRHAVGIERAQLKWLAFAGLIVVPGNILGWIPVMVWPDNPATMEVSIVIQSATIVNIVIATGIAMLRYRLWDIDIIINRTLVYGLLTATLLVVYLVLVWASQTLLSSLLGRDNNVVLVGSTLVVAALFLPLRHRIQQLIDRRFYRRKYDAQKTLDAFSSTLQEEVDLEQLCERLLTVVQETMQPAFLCLWVRPSKQRAPGDGWVESEKDFLYRMGGQDKKN
jgi:hypothetical protein